jgi:hypothetical protein
MTDTASGTGAIGAPQVRRRLHGTRQKAALALSLALVLPAGPARADIMAACGIEIGRFCADVAEGRGRIAACLIGNDARLGDGCRPEVRALADRAGRNRLLPGDVRRLLAPGFAADLPASCAADAARLCSGIDGAPTFACLYARGDRVSEACSTDARRAAGG